MSKPIIILIASRNRPVYLWACLDALHRLTRYPHRFVLFDMASDDPLVPQVIDGFRRRGTLSEFVQLHRNDPKAIAAYALAEMGQWRAIFGCIESDVVVEDSDPCWLERMVTLMQRHPRMAMLGSAIDKRDFVDPGAFPNLSGTMSPERFDSLIKGRSPERHQDISEASDGGLFRPHNPAGRLVLLRAKAVLDVGLASDGVLDQRMRSAGYETAIAPDVRHRHLSLLNVFDYPDYDLDRRNLYMSGLEEGSI